jgi:SAM-dependent methyltransferase
MDAGAAQREHYNRIGAMFETHYDDPSTHLYRERFIDAPMLQGLDLQGARVLEAMCGSGFTTGALLRRGARVTGLDISEKMIDSFAQRWPQCENVCGSITRSGFPSASFDAVVIVGGLHHMHPDVDPAVDEIHRILKPGGAFCFLEPHVGSLPDVFRRFWYKRDAMFSDNEAAVDIEHLKRKYAGDFDFTHEVYGGNVGHLFIYNSMIFRIPLRWKPLYTPLVLRLEGWIGRLQGKRLACFVVCQWRKK